MVKISIVVPCYNEEASLPLFFSAAEEVRTKMATDLAVAFEYIFVNDGSKDATLSFLRHLQAQHPDYVHYLSFSRNFGKEAAIYAGLQAAQGEYVSLMDADLQDPPALLAEMFAKLQVDTELDCVAARRTTRKGEGLFTSLFSRLFYRIMARISEIPVVDGVRDFRLMKRPLVDALLEITETNRFSKGLFAWIGFNTAYIDYENQTRVAGRSEWSFWKRLSYAVDAFVNFSDAALNVTTFTGFAVVLLDILAIIFLIIRQFIFHNSVSGWTSMTVIILLCFGVTLLVLGIIGKYLSKVFTEVKGRPIYILKEKK